MVKYIIIGFLIAFFFDSVNTILSYVVELIKSVISIKIAQCNAKIADISSKIEQSQEEQIRAIGFAIPDDDRGDLDEE